MTNEQQGGAPAGPGPTIADHVAEVSAKLQRIEKKGRAPATMGSFPFVQVTDVMEALKPELDERGMLLRPIVEQLDTITYPRQGRDGPGVLVTVTLALYVVMGAEEYLLARVVGQGADTQDKAAGKAVTSAMKQAILNAFAIPTGEDPEATNLDERGAAANGRAGHPPSRPPARREAAAGEEQAAPTGEQLPRRQRLVARVAELMREVEQLPEPAKKELNRYSVRSHVRKTYADTDSLSDLFQKGSEADVEALGRYIAARLAEAHGEKPPEAVETDAEGPAPVRAEDMPQDEALAAGAALAGKS